MKLSVIITAHNRKKFLPYAITSITTINNLVSPEIEIIVVKNFHDNYVDNLLNKIGAKNIYTEEESLGMKQYLGVKESKGDIIAFLEDDDMFSKNKVKVLLNIFSKFKVDFFHNGFIKINENRQDSFETKFDEKEVKIVDLKEIERKKNIKKIIHIFHPELYNSCITISKSLAISCLDGVRLVDINTERFWFLCAIEHKRKVALTRSPLTLYRIHSESYSQINSKYFRDFSTNLLDRYITSYFYMLNYFKDKNTKEIIREMMLLHKAHKLLFEHNNITEKTKVIIDLLRVTLNPYSVYNRYSLYVALTVLISMFNKRLALNLFYR